MKPARPTHGTATLHVRARQHDAAANTALMCRPPTQDELEESEPSLARTFWRLRAVALVACCDEALFSFATGATHYPYLRTLVRCDAPSATFSGSARCGDSDVVLERGARVHL